MLSRRDELDWFKREIDLAAFAESRGYALDRRASSRSSLIMSHANGDKVVIARGHDGHWIYFSVRDDSDHGTIIDFVQRRWGGSLGDVRKTLRAWEPSHLGSVTHAPPSPVSKDLVRIRAELQGMKGVTNHAYLEQVRGIPVDVLEHARFFGCIRSDARGNAIFPHVNELGVCGFELKNQGFTGFSPGGEKGLWLSCGFEGDKALIVVESAIDALSHFALKLPERTRYASIAGSMNAEQPELLRLEAQKLPAGSQIILATDNDEGGDRLASAIHQALETVIPSRQMLEERPSVRGTDWNDVLVGG